MLVPTAALKRFGLSWVPQSVVRLSKTDNQNRSLFIYIHGSYRGADFDEIAVRVIESDDTLSPAMRHQAVDVFNVRIEPFQLFYETVDLRYFKIQL